MSDKLFNNTQPLYQTHLRYASQQIQKKAIGPNYTQESIDYNKMLKKLEHCGVRKLTKQGMKRIMKYIFHIEIRSNKLANLIINSELKERSKF